MKRALVLFAVLLLSSTLTWAQTAGSAPAPVADPRTEGGGCQLPDLAGLAPGELPAAALNAGLQMTFEAAPAVPACPVPFQCNSIAGCAAGPLCGISSLGPCCSSGGAVLCCANGGNIKVVTCPCKCTGPLCSTACVNSAGISVNCS